MVDKVEMIPDQGEETGVTVGGPIEMPNIQAGPVKLEVPKGYKPFVQPESTVPQGFKPVEAPQAPALTEDPDVVGDRIEKVRNYFGRIEGTRPHVGADAQNLTLPFGIVPDSVMVNGQEVRAGANTLGNDVLEANPDQVELMTATKKVGNTVYKASDYNSYMEFSDAVLSAFEQELVAQMPDLPEDALPTMLSSMWNVGVNSGMQNWSGFKATVAELRKPEGSRDMSALVSMGKHAYTGGRPSVGLLKRRMEDLNLSLPPSEQIAKVDQRTINGKPVMRVFDRDGNVIRVFDQFNKASINRDQVIDLEIDDLPTVEDTPKGGRGSEGDMQEPVQEEVQQEPKPEPQQQKLDDGFYEMDDGTTVRVESGRMYDVKTGARLDVDPVQDTGPDVGTIRAGQSAVGEINAIVNPPEAEREATLGDRFAGSGNASLEGLATFTKEITGANLLPNVQKAVDEGDTAGALTEVGFELGGPVLDVLAKLKEPAQAMLAGFMKSTRGQTDEGLQTLQAAKELEEAGMPADIIWKKTGLEKGPDGQWRFEIDDSAAKIRKVPGMIPVGQKATMVNTITVDEFLDHPELIIQYPQLRNVRVGVYAPGHETIAGAKGFANGGQLIGLRADLTQEEMRSTLLHEIQHIIQNRKFEDWITGTAPKVAPDAAQMLESQKERAIELAKSADVDLESQGQFMLGAISAAYTGGKEGLNSYVKMLKDADIIGVNFTDFKLQQAENFAFFLKESGIEGMESALREVSDTLRGGIIPAYSDYYRKYGEVMSRNVQARDKMTAAQRADLPPSATQDVPDERVLGETGGPVSDLSMAVEPAFKDSFAVGEVMDDKYFKVVDRGADFDEVMGNLDNFDPDMKRVIRALDKADWIGYDTPAEALRAILRGEAMEEWPQGLKAAVGRMVNTGGS